MANRTITAMFSTRTDADRAADALRSELELSPSAVSVLAGDGTHATGAADATQSPSYEGRGFWSSLKDLFVPDEDRYAYAEGLSRGNFLVNASLDETVATRAMDILEQHGAVDLDAQETSWKQSGWQGYTGGGTGAAASGFATATAAKPTVTTATSDTAMAGRSATPAASSGTVAVTGDETIQLAEERLNIGKRDVSHGRVRVRSYVVETPASEQVTLRDEHVSIDRRPVDRPISGTDANLFRERTIEATESGEEAVVSKDVRIREEVSLRKDVEQRTETVTDTVRRTEVEVEGGRPEGQTSTTGATATPSGDPLRKPLSANFGMPRCR